MGRSLDTLVLAVALAGCATAPGRRDPPVPRAVAAPTARPGDAGGDKDRDRIPDARDQCPDDPEAYNGTDDEDGCPDRGKVVVIIDRVSITERIYFASGSRAAL